jgi:hypothetical protein
MATFKVVVLRHHRKADGTYNVKIRLIHRRVARTLPTNVMVDGGDITRSMKIKNQRYADLLDDMLRRCRRRCNEHAHELGDMSADDVAHLVADIVGGRREASEGFEIDFIAYGRSCAAAAKRAGRVGTAELYVTSLNSLAMFLGRDTLSVHEVTARLIRDWIAFIRERGAARGVAAGAAERNYPRNVRALLNAAKAEFNDEDMGVIRIPQSPFRGLKLPEEPVRGVRALDVSVIRALFSLPRESLTPGGAFALDVFKLSFLLVGINAVDLYGCTDCRGGRITYERAKVRGHRSDRGLISIRVEPEAAGLVERYRDPDGERVFGFYRRFSRADALTAKVNGLRASGGRAGTGLKEVGALVGAPDLIYYSARHSWATIARNRCGVSRDDIALSLNHKEGRLSITDVYLERDWSLIDKANRRVIDYVLGGAEA